MILPLHVILMRLILEYCVYIWCPYLGAGEESWKIGKDAESTLKIISGWRKCPTVGHWKYSICLDYSRFKGGLIMYACTFIRKKTLNTERTFKPKKKSLKKISGYKLKSDKFSLEIGHIFQQWWRFVRKSSYKVVNSPSPHTNIGCVSERCILAKQKLFLHRDFCSV